MDGMSTPEVICQMGNNYDSQKIWNKGISWNCNRLTVKP